jgi:hypothetical protein
MVEGIMWGKRLSSALESADRENKLVLIDFTSPT